VNALEERTEVRAYAGKRESAPCPKCGSQHSAIVIEGRDLLHGVPGVFYVSECARCGLWFQSPRRPAAFAAEHYPADYAPHAVPAGGSGPHMTEPAEGSRPGVMTPAGRFGPAVTAPAVGRSPAVASPGAAPRAAVPGPADGDPRGALRRWLLPGPDPDALGLVPRLVPGGRLLEVGCASGARLLELRARGWADPVGIELSASAAATARGRGLDVRCGDAETMLSAIPDGSLDAVIASMVLEHFYDPFAAVRLIAAKLTAGGQFLFSTVCRDSLDAALYRAYWRNLDLPRHMVWLRRRDIRDMLAREFEGVEILSQAEPVDFTGSAAMRLTERSGVFDRMVTTLGEARLVRACRVLARLGLTSRVSVRCRRA
jgi:SAM-dependent methyltransferase